MSFDRILSQWEKQKKKQAGEKQAEQKRRDRDPDTAGMGDWLELYPPDRKMAKRKETPDRIITHTKKKQLNRMEPQDTLDLHGWTGREALRELDYFLKKVKDGD